MRAIRVTSQDFEDPLAGLSVVDLPEPTPKPGWVPIRVVAAALNPHDIWTLRGVGHPAERVPMTLGCDAAGYDPSGRPVIVYPTLGDVERGGGDISMAPDRGLLSETVDGTLADTVLVPERHLVPKPESLSFEEAAVIPVVFGTAYRMLFTRGGLRPGQRVLVQGAAGGVSSAAILLARAAGAVVYATSRSEEGRAFAATLGAVPLETGARLPEHMDLVIETVGEATWAHSLRAARRGGTIVIAGATSGSMPPADLTRVFFHQLSIVGSVGSTLDELQRAVQFIADAGIRPPIALTVPVERVREGCEALIAGGLPGKVVVTFAELPG